MILKIQLLSDIVKLDGARSMGDITMLAKVPDMGEQGICSVCRTPVRFTNIAGVGGYVHLIDDDFDTMHIPDPVPMREYENFSGLCDFCSTLTHASVFKDLVTEPFDMVVDGHLINFDPLWACCPVCYSLLKKGDWDSLTQRSIENAILQYGASHGDAETQFIQNLHHIVRQKFIRLE